MTVFFYGGGAHVFLVFPWGMSAAFPNFTPCGGVPPHSSFAAVAADPAKRPAGVSLPAAVAAVPWGSLEGRPLCSPTAS